MEKLCWSLIEPHLVLHGLEEIACLDDSHPFFLRSSFESSVWRYFHALSSTVLACLESILLLPLLMRWPNQKAAVQKQTKSSFRASSCSTILIVRDFLGTTFTSTSHLTSESNHIYSCLILFPETISNSPGRSFGFGEESGRSTYQGWRGWTRPTDRT